MALLCVATAPATQPDATSYPALQHLLSKVETQNKTLIAQNAGLIRDNIALKEQVTALTPKPKQRAGNVPDDGKPHADSITVGITLDEALDLAGVGNMLASKKTATSTIYFVYVWDHEFGEAIKDRHIWGTISVSADGRVIGIMPR